jgi:hypothetical protein
VVLAVREYQAVAVELALVVVLVEQVEMEV